MVRFLTSKKCHCTSLFADNESDCTLVYHQDSISTAETKLKKRACEAKLRKYGKEVRDCHADNEYYAVAKHK